MEKGKHLEIFTIGYDKIKPDSLVINHLIPNEQCELKTGQKVVIKSFNVQLITDDINESVKDTEEIEKKIVIKHCNECPAKSILFSKKGEYYCNKLSNIIYYSNSWINMPTLDKEINIPKTGILENCPLKNNY